MVREGAGLKGDGTMYYWAHTPSFKLPYLFKNVQAWRLCFLYSICISEQILTKNGKIGWETFILYAFKVSPLKLVAVGDYNLHR